MQIAHCALVSVVTVVLTQSALSAPASQPAVAVPGQFNARVHLQGGNEHGYQLYIPKDYAPGKSCPLIVWLHGSGQKGTDNKQQIKGIDRTFLGDGAKNQVFVLAPQCLPDMAWHGVGLGQPPHTSEAALAVVAEIEEVRKEFKIDDRRIYVGGFSMGGCGVWEMLIRYPKLFAAGFPVCGLIGDRPECPKLVKDVPVWAFLYEKDPTGSNESDKTAFKEIQKLGGEVKSTQYPGTGHEFLKALAEPELVPWLLSKQRSEAADPTPAKVPDGGLMILKTKPDGAHGTWTGELGKGRPGMPRFMMDNVNYRLRAADGAPAAVEEMMVKGGKGDVTGRCEVTGTVSLEDNAWIVVEKIEMKK